MDIYKVMIYEYAEVSEIEKLIVFRKLFKNHEFK